jgi:hypothetical protein
MGETGKVLAMAEISMDPMIAMTLKRIGYISSRVGLETSHA